MGNYFLISRTQGIPYQQYRGDALRILKTIPATVDEVVIGIKNNRKKVNKLTVFKDEKGNVIERCYDNTGKPFRNLVYSREENVIDEDEFVKSISCKEYSMQRKLAKKYREKRNHCNDIDVLLKAFWKKLKLRTDHISDNINNAEKVISSSEIDYKNGSDMQIHCFSEYSHLLKGKKSGKEKTLAFAVSADGHSVIPKTKVMSKGLVFPQKDKYLPYRALDIESSKLLITRRALNDRNLKGAMITIKPDYMPEEDEINDIAIFKNWHGDICFNKLVKYTSKGSVVSSAYHESEHAWQYFLDARLLKGGTPWGDLIYFQFGPLKNRRQIKEAKRYSRSIKYYIPYDGTNYKKYIENFIEIKAHDAGRKAKKEYIKQGEIMRKNFPHIPAELL